MFASRTGAVVFRVLQQARSRRVASMLGKVRNGAQVAQMECRNIHPVV
jgi:hypothetical protein